MDLFTSEQDAYRYQSGVQGRGLTLGRRFLYAIRLILNLWVPFAEWSAVMGRKGIKRNRSVQVMNDLCNATNGVGLDVGGKFIKVLRKSETKRFDEEKLPDLLEKSSMSEEEIAQIVQTLRTDGFAVIRKFTSLETATRLREEVESAHAVDWRGQDYRDFHEWAQKGETSRIDVDEVAVNRAVEASNINLSDIDVIARRYLESAPIRLPAQCWITHTRSELTTSDLEETAMSFHCDSDFVSFFKIFLLLTPVSSENGPFAFVAKSHLGRRQVQGRVSDRNLQIGDDELRLGTGSPGDLVLAVTSGWHKGTPVRSGHRTMIQWLYSTSLFGRATK